MNYSLEYSRLKMVATMYASLARNLNYTPELRQLFIEERMKYEHQALLLLKELLATA